jgi:hypothetical protein
MNWPGNKDFAFTIIDDTDKATIDNIKPVYDFLYQNGLITTKTVWSFPTEDEFKGDTLKDEEYKNFIKDLADKGYEVGFHGAGSGDFIRGDVLESFEDIKKLIGSYPKVHLNHAFNKNNLFWSYKRFTPLIGFLYKHIKKIFKMEDVVSQGDVESSPFFWGDFAKEHVRYIRNRVFTGLDTISYDKYMPYKEKRKEKYSNYWFSSSDGIDLKTFLSLLSKENVDKLEYKRGCAIVYVHFAYGFTDENKELNEEFKNRIRYLASKNGWFVPAGDILDYLASTREKDMYLEGFRALALDVKWMAGRIYRKLFMGV